MHGDLTVCRTYKGCET